MSENESGISATNPEGLESTGEPAEVGRENVLEKDEFDGLFTLMQRDRDARTRKYREYAASDVYPQHLHAAYQSYGDEEDLQPGDLVQWKTFLRSARLPEYGAPAIVVRLAARAPVAGKPDHTDIVIAYLDAEQDLKLVATERRRLTAWAPGES